MREPNVWPPETELHRDGGLLTRHLPKRLVAYFSLKAESEFLPGYLDNLNNVE